MLANFKEVVNTCEGSSYSLGVISLCCSVSSSSVGTLSESLGNAGDCVSKGWHLHNLEMTFSELESYLISLQASTTASGSWHLNPHLAQNL